MATWLWLVACGDPEGPAEQTTLPTAPTDTPPGTTPPTPTTSTTDGCAPSDTVGVVAAGASPGRLSNQAVVSITTTTDVPVAVRCTSTTDPADVHLLEDAGGIDHTWDIGGLLPNDTYDCLAAATCPVSAAGPIPFTITTGNVPADLVAPGVEIDEALGATGGYAMFNLEVCGSSFDWIHLVDLEGRTRWWHAVSTAPNIGLEVRHQGDNVIVWGGGYTPVGRPRRVDVFGGEFYDSADVLLDYGSTNFHHDGKQLADGRIMTLEANTTFSGPAAFEGFDVRLHDPEKGTVDWEWSTQTAVDRGQLDPGSAYGDVWHGNWADVKVENGADKIYISLCYYYQIIKVDAATGDIEWTFGPGGDFSLIGPGGSPLPDTEFSSCQHGLEVSDDGTRLLVYDNGWDSGQSRIVEYAIDQVTHEAQLLWDWTDGWYNCCLGDADYLSNGRVTLTQAYGACGGTPSKQIELDPATLEVASTITLRPSDGTYRSERLDGCELFAHTGYCSALGARNTELDGVFAP
jgi:Arylsulfotransferase (ASST)